MPCLLSYSWNSVSSSRHQLIFLVARAFELKSFFSLPFPFPVLSFLGLNFGASLVWQFSYTVLAGRELSIASPPLTRSDGVMLARMRRRRWIPLGWQLLAEQAPPSPLLAYKQCFFFFLFVLARSFARTGRGKEKMLCLSVTESQNYTSFIYSWAERSPMQLARRDSGWGKGGGYDFFHFTCNK